MHLIWSQFVSNCPITCISVCTEYVAYITNLSVCPHLLRCRQHCVVALDWNTVWVYGRVRRPPTESHRLTTSRIVVDHRVWHAPRPRKWTHHNRRACPTSPTSLCDPVRKKNCYRHGTEATDAFSQRCVQQECVGAWQCRQITCENGRRQVARCSVANRLVRIRRVRISRLRNHSIRENGLVNAWWLDRTCALE